MLVQCDLIGATSGVWQQSPSLAKELWSESWMVRYALGVDVSVGQRKRVLSQDEDEWETCNGSSVSWRINYIVIDIINIVEGVDLM